MGMVTFMCLRDVIIMNVVKVVLCYLMLMMIIMVIMGTCALYKVNRDLTADLRRLEWRVIRAEKVLKEHDEIMATYKFFNEHWTATMCGEER